MWRFRRKRTVRRRVTTVTKHYQEHKELARELVLARLTHYNQHYQLKWNRVAIRNQRRCWGSCSSLGNLNFNYKIYFLPPELRDYIIVHELCHLRELNHGAQFWALVSEQFPQYREAKKTLQIIDRAGHSVHLLKALQKQHEGQTSIEIMSPDNSSK